MNETRSAEFDAKSYRRAQELFNVLVSLEPDVRGARLELECRDDQTVRVLVERLLKADAEPAEFNTNSENQDFFANKIGFPDQAHGSEEGELAEPGIGDRLSRYVILHTIGAGGMGVVYAAYDPELDRRVALKLLHADRERPRARARLQREAKAMAQVSHTNVVSVYDVGAVAERVFIAMEYVEGTTLKGWMLGDHDWRAVINMFLDAGRGLQAAHKAGLIHRDFKPDNVLVTTEGRAKVTDFGIVRATETEEGEWSSDTQSTHTGSADAGTGPVELERLPGLATPLTRAGAVLGTPAYMAPEQFLGETADARSDQFAFCTALYEALWGKHPFEGLSYDELSERVLATESIEIPRGGGVPSWLAAVVIRGLHRTPSERWPSMTALLRALQDDPSQRRRIWLGVAAGVSLVLAASFGLWFDERHALAECQASADAIDVDWNRKVAADTRAVMVATQLDFASDTAARVELGINTWVSTWREARVDACAEVREGVARGEARVRCLDAQRETLVGFLGVLAEADRFTVVRAMRSVVELPRAETCVDPALLAIGEEAVPDGVHRQIARVQTFNSTKRYAEALLEAKDLLDNPFLPASPVLHIEARLAAARAHSGAGDMKEERILIEDAYYDASRIGHDPLALSTSLELLANAANQADFDRAESWSRQAQSLVGRLGNKSIDLARLHENRGWMLLRSGAFPDAEVELVTALGLYEQVHGVGDPVLANLLADIAFLLAELQRYDEAGEMLARAKELTITGLGPDHPDVARREQAQGELETRQGHFDAGRPLLERSLATLERAYGPEDNVVVVALNSLAILETYAGNHSRALELIERAIDIKERHDGGDGHILGNFRGNAAVMQQGLGRYDEAKVNYELALRIHEAAAGPDYLPLGQLHCNLGDLLMEYEQFDAAREHFERSIVIHDAGLGPGSLDTLLALADLGDLHCRVGEIAKGRETLDRALAIGDPEAMVQTKVHFVLTRCLIASQSKDEALVALARAVEIATLRAEPGSLDLADYLSEAATLELELDQPELALGHARAAFEIIHAHEHVAVLPRARAKLNLARALAESELEPARSEALVGEARVLLEGADLPAVATKSLDAMLDAWPRARGTQ